MNDQVSRTMGRHVLIVEDDVDVRDTLSELLTSEGFEVATATGGRDALNVLSQGTLPALILMDLVMPQMDGIEFRLKLLEDPVLKRVPVVILTGSSDASGIAASIKADGFLKKPVQIEALIRTVRSYVAAPQVNI